MESALNESHALLRENSMRILAWPIESPTNPYTSLLYSHIGRDARVEEFSAKKLIEHPSVWHVHWPEALLNIRHPVHAALKVAGFFAALDILQAGGTKLIWTVHNCHAHERLHASLEAWFWRRFLPRVDGAISLSATGLAHALQRFPQLRDTPKAVIPHGHYRSEYSAPTRDARKLLGIRPEAKVALFVGAVRGYKNVEGLVRAFRSVQTPSAALHVVGKPNSAALARNILNEATFDDRVQVRFDFLEPELLSAYVGAADFVVLPYREILNSGSALLALSLNRPILVPDLGALRELQADFGDRWVRTFTGELGAAALEGALEWSQESRPEVCPMPEKYEWHSIAEQTLRFYQLVVSGQEAAAEKSPFASAEGKVQKA
jgi:beta-1,4-mannosyltransferase